MTFQKCSLSFRLGTASISNIERATIALICHATGTGKTVTAVSDAKRFGKRTLFLAHSIDLVNQAADTFKRVRVEDN